MTKYVVVVILGLAIHGAIVLPLIIKFVAKRNPFTFVKGMSESLLTAASTATAKLTETDELLVERRRTRCAIHEYILSEDTDQVSDSYIYFLPMRPPLKVLSRSSRGLARSGGGDQYAGV